MKRLPVIRIDDKGKHNLMDPVATERIWKLQINDESPRKLVSSEYDLQALLTGCLFTNGLIAIPSDIQKLQVDEGKSRIQIETGRKSRSVEHSREETQFKLRDIFSLITSFAQASDRFVQTGAYHSAGLAKGAGIELLADDISRQNAVDRLIGKMLLQNKKVASRALLLSCRVGEEIFQKAASMGFALVISQSAVTDLAVDMAKITNTTLVGFARDRRLNIYHEGRCEIVD